MRLKIDASVKVKHSAAVMTSTVRVRAHEAEILADGSTVARQNLDAAADVLDVLPQCGNLFLVQNTAGGLGIALLVLKPGKHGTEKARGKP